MDPAGILLQTPIFRDLSIRDWSAMDAVSRVNLGQVLAGGLLTGVIINVGEIMLNFVLLADRWEAARSALGLGAETGAGIALFMARGARTAW